MAEIDRRTTICISIGGIIYGAIMTAVGYTYKDECNNGAAEWLAHFGIVLLCSEVIVIMTSICCYTDNRGEQSMCFNCATLINVVINVMVTIWGSVVVFGAWADWTDNVDEIDENNYCHKVPMLTAFILLILRWVLVPTILCCCCCAAFGLGVGMMGINLANEYSRIP